MATRHYCLPRYASDESGANHQHIYAADLDDAELLEIYFAPIIRDGPNIAEVQLKLIDILAALQRIHPRIFSGPLQKMLTRVEQTLANSTCL